MSTKPSSMRSPDRESERRTKGGDMSSSRMLWTFAISSIALFMVTLDNLVVTTAIPVIREDLHASLSSLEWTVNAYTLTFAVLLLTGAALGDRFGRRRVFAVGIGIFTLGSIAAALAPSVETLNLARAFQGLGGAIVMPLTLTILSSGGASREARPCPRRVGRHRRSGRRIRSAGGRRHRSGDRLAVDLLAERPHRRPAHPARALAAEGELRAGGPARPARARARERGSVRDRVGPRPRQQRRLGEPADRDGAARRARARGRVRRLGAAHRCADAADALLPQRDVRAREHRFAVHVLRHVRLDLPAGAVLPDGAGLLAARLRPALPALDARADVHRATRRSALGQDPGEEPDRRRPRDAGGRARLDGVGRRHPRRRTRS